MRMKNHSRNPVKPGDGTEAFESGEIFTRPMKAGDVVELEWFVRMSETNTNHALESRPELVYPGFKIRPPQAAHPTGHWHDERKGHGQVGLAKDGLFPATRKAY